MPSPLSSSAATSPLHHASRLLAAIDHTMQQLRHASNVSAAVSPSADPAPTLDIVIDLNGNLSPRLVEARPASLPPQQVALHELYLSFAVRPQNLTQFQTLMQRIAAVCAPALAEDLGELARYDFARNVLMLNEALTPELCRDALNEYTLAAQPFSSILLQLRRNYAYLLAREVALPVAAESGALRRAEADIASLTDLNVGLRSPIIADVLDTARQTVRQQRLMLILHLSQMSSPADAGPARTRYRLVQSYEVLKWLRSTAQTEQQQQSWHARVVEFSEGARLAYPDFSEHFPERY
ncbi:MULTISPECIES: hypothetical protein [unclassified Undibacterium]|uniref:hypothetical protein n=1 Tax=unclassified Undibacterium TaxID=2630295 RepID=UPI002AC9DDAF|nr:MULTISPECIES: hypothetical protein [unclassified Undibacterium]MEB0138568.1 hypothetical protein [Undibacterium sp. CCC2.1]MEB0171368.1 hypothetical protein [Undibacterium sp. CCC1.1]MEB0175332.1 hypothetical protein [Undibacterium sp. CCC3.4]MEB0214564.1 hypothetical protein [Undibacterium sp. 5I2]WPX43061.1 hypothetical protein RHM61_17025 [Undibacterium sp. CCC3.4]